MDNKELDSILQEGEGFKIEFKEGISNLDKEMVAFANAEGGRIFLGVTDAGKAVGITPTNAFTSQIQDIANNCDPSVTISLKKVDCILVVEVEEGKQKPYRCSSGFYMRVGPNSQKMKTGDIRNLIFAQGQIKFDNQQMNTFDFKDFDQEAFVDYLKRAGIPPAKDKKSRLFNLGVFDGITLNNTGVLFFSKNPKKYLINAYVTCARYKGTDKVNVIDRKDIEANVVKQLEDSIKFIERNTTLSYEIKGLIRKEIPEYPLEALREAILNALMHRDYTERGANVQIDIFDDRISITNIGGLIKPLTKERLGEIAVRRNPLIADLFYRINLVEKMGTGIKRMQEECIKQGNITLEIKTNGYFIATFRRTAPVTASVNAPLKVSALQTEILKKVVTNNSMTYTQLADILKRDKATIRRNIQKLKELGIMKRIGSDKGGHWEVLLK
ncbi:putative DNA binding domain-containing protein [Candidatus Woesearchaeota archaeon]|nr:putative DNA binding domain-containing protein [Candidatus Woesearchaeota archaeon]